MDHILWESDYPHADTPFPHAQAAVKAQFAGVPDDKIREMSRANAEQLFKFPRSQALIDQYSG